MSSLVVALCLTEVSALFWGAGAPLQDSDLGVVPSRTLFRPSPQASCPLLPTDPRASALASLARTDLNTSCPLHLPQPNTEPVPPLCSATPQWAQTPATLGRDLTLSAPHLLTIHSPHRDAVCPLCSPPVAQHQDWPQP